jgi:hypothetical protein
MGLILQHRRLLSAFAFDFKLRRYDEDDDDVDDDTIRAVVAAERVAAAERGPAAGAAAAVAAAEAWRDRRCVGCGLTSTTRKFQLCGGCRRAYYCSGACQGRAVQVDPTNRTLKAPGSKGLNQKIS